MATKRIELADIGTVSLFKRRGARHVRLSVGHNGEIRVTLPFWAPYQVGIDFVKTKADWIRQQRPEPRLLQQKQTVGKAHHLVFVVGEAASVTTRLVGNEIRILLPAGTKPDDPEAQSAAHKAAVRALKKEAKGLLGPRLRTLADQHGFTYRSMTIKQLKGRWGSCSEHKDIVLNCYLMELPWHLIDYVLLHELVHTRIMAHGTVFWDEVGRYVPNLGEIRRQIRLHRPVLN